MVNSAKFINLLRADGELVETFADIGEIWKEWIKIYNADVPKIFFILCMVGLTKIKIGANV